MSSPHLELAMEHDGTAGPARTKPDQAHNIDTVSPPTTNDWSISRLRHSMFGGGQGTVSGQCEEAPGMFANLITLGSLLLVLVSLPLSLFFVVKVVQVSLYSFGRNVLPSRSSVRFPSANINLVKKVILLQGFMLCVFPDTIIVWYYSKS